MYELFLSIALTALAGVDLPAQASRPHNTSRFEIHKLTIQPATAGLQIHVPPGALVDDERAASLARQARQQLRADGFLNADVDYDLAPISTGKADLRLLVNAGTRTRVREVEFAGDLRFGKKKLRNSLGPLRTRTILPWWHLRPAYTPELGQAGLARLRSFYLRQGYFDVSVKLDEPEIQGSAARLRFTVVSGERRDGFDAAAVCASLLSERREAQRDGVLEFSAALHPANLEVTTGRGPSYRVGRIEFAGNHHYSDSLLRRSFLLAEGQVFDETVLRQSIARLDRMGIFDPVDADHVGLHIDRSEGVADVRITLNERKRGSWHLSGPVGPASFAGPLEASIGSRLPSWGAGLFNLSLNTVSIGVSAFTQPLIPALAAITGRPLFPILALWRPFTPIEGWRSGFAIIPQLGWRATALSYGTTQLQQRLLPILAGNRGLVPELPVQVEGASDGAVLFCEPPAPRFSALRTAAGLTLRLAGSLTGQ